MTAKTILVIEDDSAIRGGILDALTFEGYATLEASNGKDGLQMAIKTACDLILLDLVLPGPDGLTILQEVRQSRPTLPIILLTAKGAENDRVHGLRLGADDYVVKPFSVKELLARVEAVLRRSPERSLQIKQAKIPGGLINLDRCEISFQDGLRVELSEREIELLHYLITNASRVISREEILTRVWRISATGLETRTIDMHIVRLREKLREDKQKPTLLLTVRGKGYMFAPFEEKRS